MKDKLLDRPPTIGAYRLQGVVEIEVRCRRPCKRVGRVALYALRLPDDTILQNVTKLRRLRCTQCDRLVAEVAPIFPVPEAPPIGDVRPVQWIVVLQEGVSSPLWSREHALRFARDETAAGRKVVRIEGPAGIIDAEEIAAWRAARLSR